MFRFARNHHQALSKKYEYKDPLHKTIKTRFGIPNVHNKLLITIHMSLLTVIRSLSLGCLKQSKDKDRITVNKDMCMITRSLL